MASRLAALSRRHRHRSHRRLHHQPPTRSPAAGRPASHAPSCASPRRSRSAGLAAAAIQAFEDRAQLVQKSRASRRRQFAMISTIIEAGARAELSLHTIVADRAVDVASAAMHAQAHTRGCQLEEGKAATRTTEHATSRPAIGCEGCRGAALGRQQHTASKRVGVTKSPAHQIMMRVNVQGSCSCFATTLRSPLAHLLRTQGHSREVRRVARLYQCRSTDSMGGEVYAAEAGVRGDWRRTARWLNEAGPSCAGRGRAWHGRSA